MRYPLGLLLNFPPGNSDGKITFYAIKFRKYPICILNTTAAFTDIFLYNFEWEYSHSVIFVPAKLYVPPYPPGGDGTPLYKTYRNMPPNCADPNGRVFLQTFHKSTAWAPKAGRDACTRNRKRTLKKSGFLRRFGLKTGIDCLFWSGIGYGLQGNYSSVWAFLSFSSKRLRKKEKMQMQNGF